MRLPDIDATQLASTTSPPATRPRELASEQPAPPTVVRTRRRDPAARRGVWSPRTTLAYCWRSRTLLVLGAWLAVSPVVLGTTGDRHSTESALLTGLLLMGTAFWAMATREPVPPHAGSVSLGLWLLVAPSLWYFQSPVASHHSRAVGLLVVMLSAWALWTGPRTRPPLDPGAGSGHRGSL
jgi:SPW repeat